MSALYWIIMATSYSSSNKRQRHDGDVRHHSNPMQQQRMQLTDIPDALLVRSAEYLSNTSCVSFAMALTPQNMMSQQPSANNMAIVNKLGILISKIFKIFVGVV